MSEELEVTGQELDLGVDPGPGEETPAESLNADPTEGVAPTPWSFTFTVDGREKVFNSPEEASQYFASWNGRLSKQAKLLDEYRQENERWANWFEQNQGKDGSPPQANAKETKQVSDAADDAVAKGLLSQTDWQYVRELLQNGQAGKALQYLTFKTDEYLKAQVTNIQGQFEEKLNSTFGPIQEREAAQTLARDLMLAAQNSADHEGNPTYPEFQEGSSMYDPEFVTVFGAVWRKLPPQLALDPEGWGVDLAYHRTHALINAYKANQASAVNAATATARDATGRFQRQTEAAATAVGGSRPTNAAERPDPNNIGTFKERLNRAGKRDEFTGVAFE